MFAYFRRFALLLVLVAGPIAPAGAAVEIAFYSRDGGGGTFPHAFVAFSGTLDSTGEAIESSYGFTAKAITPAILLGSVAGEVIVEGERQIERSDRQFALILTDEQYFAAMAVVEAWRTRRQPSYNLNRRNCIHFVGQIAGAVGLQVDYQRRLLRKPREFLQHVMSLNPQLESEPPTAVAASH